jgi:hypothetical protein
MDVLTLPITTYVAIGLVVFFLVFTYIRGIYLEKRYLEREVNFFKSTYKVRQGYTQGWGNYRLFSPDGGISWFATTRDFDTGKVDILGPVEEVHPGLMAHLEGWDDLMNYLNTEGSITIGEDGISDEESSLLTGAGFTVTAKQ